jgi:hypothetical protein
VPADIVKRAEDSGGIASNDDTLAAYIAQEILAGLANLPGSAGTDPAMEEEPFHFLLE